MVGRSGRLGGNGVPVKPTSLLPLGTVEVQLLALFQLESTEPFQIVPTAYVITGEKITIEVVEMSRRPSRCASAWPTRAHGRPKALGSLPEVVRLPRSTQ